jgi:hypothetical protein
MKKTHNDKVKALAKKLKTEVYVVNQYWTEINRLINEGKQAELRNLIVDAHFDLLRRFHVDAHSQDFELFEVSNMLDTSPNFLRPHFKKIAAFKMGIKTGVPGAIDAAKEVLKDKVPILSETKKKVESAINTANEILDKKAPNLFEDIEKIVDSRIAASKKNDTRKHYNIMSWAVSEIGSIEAAAKALEAVRVMQ